MQSVRRLGILGGLSWASSLKYYELINLEILKLTGGTRSGDIVLWSFDYTHFPPLLAAGDWKSIAHLLQDAADKLVKVGVTSILNFAPVVLSVPAGVTVRKVDLAVELQILSYHEQRRAATAASGQLHAVPTHGRRGVSA